MTASKLLLCWAMVVVCTAHVAMATSVPPFTEDQHESRMTRRQRLKILDLESKLNRDPSFISVSASDMAVSQGAECKCDIQSDATKKTTTTIVSCQTASNLDTTFMPTCHCNGFFVNCPHAGVRETFVEPLTDGVCNGFTPMKSRGECTGEPCPNKGTQTTRIQSSTTHPDGVGVDCFNYVTIIPCTTPAPCHCQVKFSDPSPCSATCGVGVVTQAVEVVQEPSNGGNPCPAARSTECTNDPCPTHCVINETWSEFSPCSVPCGPGGSIRRTRQVLTHPANGGSPCPPTADVQPCPNSPVCNKNCTFTAWSSPTDCSATCGDGITTQTRTIKTNATGTGSCGPTVLQTPCNKGDCPVDCVVSGWSNYTTCSVSCGAGTHTRKRSVIVPQKGAGKPCPTPLEQVSECNTEACPVDCVLSEFGNFTSCDVSCGGGFRAKSRSVIRQAAHGGKTCAEIGSLVHIEECNTQECPDTCEYQPWGNWSQCSQSCAGGTKIRFRAALPNPSNVGQVCNRTEESAPCNDFPCVEDCVPTPWGGWSQCTLSCGGGVRTRTRSTATPAKNGGKDCNLKEEEPCNTKPCPVNCVTEPTEWSKCDAICGGGLQTRHHRVLVNESNGGKPCPDLVETRECNLMACNTTCTFTPWSKWSTCSLSCGGGRQTRERTVTDAPPGLNHSLCGQVKQEQECNTKACPQNCVLSWALWSNCSASCGGGTRSRTATVVQPASNGGTPCPELQDTEICGTEPCPIHCKTSGWSQWSACTAQCGGGTSTRTTTIETAAQYGGKACGPTSETIECNNTPCKIDCLLSQWSNYTQCSHSCGGGVKTRSRTIVVPDAYGGRPCSSMPLTDPVECNSQPCPEDCIMSEWTPFKCDTSCGGGTAISTAQILRPARNGGKACPSPIRYQECNMAPCPGCKYSSWSNATCSATCGAGTKHHYRTVLSGNATTCNETSRTVPCNAGPCPVNCKVSDWGVYSNCTSSCGGGSKTRRRSVLQSASNGGKACPNLTETVSCNTEACSVDCLVHPWSDWSTCSRSCGGGTHTRTRTVARQASGKGATCPPTHDSAPCNTQPCPVNCSVSPFGDWSKCSVTCGSGVQHRSRSILTPDANGGKLCPDLTEFRDCSPGECAVKCNYTLWSDYSACSRSCGGGLMQKVRLALSHPEQCKDTVRIQSCHSHECPKDCVATPWSEWTACSASCGGGHQFRYREAFSQEENGGKPCSPLTETRACGDADCPVDCVTSAWSEWTNCTQTCNGGVKERTRKVIVPAKGRGKACGDLKQTVSCNMNSCSPSCPATVWSDWSPCSSPCGGVRTRTRSATSVHSCGPFTQTAPCPATTCNGNCQYSSWCDWSPCHQDCRTGRLVQVRGRSLLSGDTSCTALVQERTCEVVQPAPRTSSPSHYYFGTHCLHNHPQHYTARLGDGSCLHSSQTASSTAPTPPSRKLAAASLLKSTLNAVKAPIVTDNAQTTTSKRSHTLGKYFTKVKVAKPDALSPFKPAVIEA